MRSSTIKYKTLHEQQLLYLENPKDRKVEKDFYESLHYCLTRKYQQKYRTLGVFASPETIKDNATISACRLLERIHRKGSDYIIRSWDSMFNFEMLDLMYKKSESKHYKNGVDTPIDEYTDLYTEQHEEDYEHDTLETLLRTIQIEYKNYINIIDILKKYSDFESAIKYLSLVLTEEQLRKDIYLFKYLHRNLHEKI